MLPVRYFTSNAISGIPLINLALVLVLITWALYVVQQNLHKRFSFISIFLSVCRKKLAGYANRGNINFILKVMMVFIALYLYALSFIAWTQIPTIHMFVHTDGYATPWYVYSVRLGLTGLLGLLFALSYLFKRFEKEVIVFGIIVIAGFFAGPFYDEMRFSKYVMVGIIGFASLLIFKIISFTNSRKPIITGIIIGSILVTAGFSTLMLDRI